MEQLSLSGISPKADFENIPIIDVAALKSPDRRERQRLAREIYDACTQVGFFYIKVTYISSRFQIPLIINICPAESWDIGGANNGSSRCGASILRPPRRAENGIFCGEVEEEISNADDPCERTDTNNIGALLESFDIGYEILADPQRAADDVLPPDTYDLYGDNQWPSNEVLPKFRETYLLYCAEALTLCRRLMRSFALALGLDEGFFDPVMNFPGVTSRLLHYPPQTVEGEVRDGLGAHTITYPHCKSVTLAANGWWRLLFQGRWL
ncbi:unnamed protein product [Aspergillus oryzae RIB40]|uniref:DNA, SC012 n=1 Tax=Aspergillus oryzae (strain ATCC 42149 / RIB 40) TaxID=510516 RepID=Q2UD34_ASPOR|nr:unnamed protein product [Aspergillus oryzae RIB40]BAE60531.1 unnamed protein product [Aspergillus oryzae RIB40]